jgi:hypothetical protein
MDIQTFRNSATNFEIIKYYWPESLSGQANSATGHFKHLPDLHYMFTRENGTRTCSCGLVYWGPSLPLDSNPWGLSMDEFGHRNHQTGELEPYHKSAVRKLQSPTEHIFECEWCGTTSMQDGFFDESNDHKCELGNLPDSRLIWITASLDVQRKKFSLPLFDQHPERLDLGLLDIKLGLEGATISSSSPDFRASLNKMLADGQLLISEELHKGSDELSDWPSEYVNPTQAEIELFWETEQKNKNRYLLSNMEDFGYFKFSNATFGSNSLVRYTMTKEAFTINAARSNMPIMRMPVIGLR